MAIPADATIADEALRLALAWGPDMGQPTQPRLAAAHPALTPAELDAYDAIARDAMKTAGDIVTEQIGRLGQSDASLQSVCKEQVVALYPWVSAGTFQKIFQQGRYFAWHDGIGG